MSARPHAFFVTTRPDSLGESHDLELHMTTYARAAAQICPTASSRGVQERLFAKLFNGLVYPQIWEDPRVDLEALALPPGSRIIAIAPGGYNVMSYLSTAPARILAVDLSPAHIALLELKLAAAKVLEQQEFYQLFGNAASKRNRATWCRLRPHVSTPVRAFWEQRTLGGRSRVARFEGGFYRSGALGRTIGAAHLFARVHGRNPSRLLAAGDLDEQRRTFAHEIAPIFESPVFRLLSRLPLTFFGLGILPAQLDELRGDAANDLARVVRARTERLACDFPLADNYFAWQAFGRRYAGPEGSLPPYLEHGSFARIKAFAERVDPWLSDLTSRLAHEPAASLDAFCVARRTGLDGSAAAD